MPKRKKNSQRNFTDWFTVGHFTKGYFTYLLTYIILTVTGCKNDVTVNLSFGITLLLALGWEFLENFVLYRWKTNGKRDCIKNTLTDILFDSIGALIGLLTILLIYHIWR